jgi:hypothetical protein
MDLFVLLAGVAILLLGRPLFWVFVAALGAVAGGQIALAWCAGHPHAVWIEVGAVAGGGLAGALLAILLQPVAAALAGFAVGGLLAQDFVLHWHFAFLTTANGMPAYHWQGYPADAWVPFLVGGAIGAVLTLLLFNWALIVLSSLYGASLIVKNFPWPGTWREHDGTLYFYVALVAVGIAVQAVLLHRKKGLF